MGEVQTTLFRPEFNPSLFVKPTVELLSADGGAVLLRELGERLGMWRRLGRKLDDPRDPELIVHPYVELVRTAVLLRGQGWSTQDDVDILRHDPVFRLAVSERRSDRALRPPEKGKEGREPDGLASQPTLSRFYDSVSEPRNRRVLEEELRVGAVQRIGASPTRRLGEVNVDLDSLPCEVHGHQPGSAYNGHYRCACFHPLLLSWEFGDFLGATLRPGNVYTSHEARAFVLPRLEWVREHAAERVWLRIDAGFPSEAFFRALEERGFPYVARLKSNAVLQRMAAPYVDAVLELPVPEEEERTHFVELEYQAEPKWDAEGNLIGGWSRSRRVVLVVVERLDALLPDFFFLVTSEPKEAEPAEALLARYRQRATTEKDYGDWTNALDLSLSSTNRPKTQYRGKIPSQRAEPVDSFAVNEATLLVSLLTANLIHAARVLVARVRGELWSRERFRKLVLKATSRVARSSRYVTLWVTHAATEHWRALWIELAKAHPARGSPQSRALSTPA